ncbi:hypothetical protein BJ166DRAFT_510391 [Pestalotiopsis sp. NC0098]|nr:hypothetical protein BJ166DRAFT_510391 [Pestalotiopsis sp. NC0098]
MSSSSSSAPCANIANVLRAPGSASTPFSPSSSSSSPSGSGPGALVSYRSRRSRTALRRAPSRSAAVMAWISARRSASVGRTDAEAPWPKGDFPPEACASGPGAGGASPSLSGEGTSRQSEWHHKAGTVDSRRHLHLWPLYIQPAQPSPPTQTSHRFLRWEQRVHSSSEAGADAWSRAALRLRFLAWVVVDRPKSVLRLLSGWYRSSRTAGRSRRATRSGDVGLFCSAGYALLTLSS